VGAGVYERWELVLMQEPSGVEIVEQRRLTSAD
jgi:hypothetical protein